MKLSKHLRTAVEQLKLFYIKKIVDTGLHKETYQELKTLTVTELEAIYKHENILIIDKKYPSKMIPKRKK
jgi:hypothetical protein